MIGEDAISEIQNVKKVKIGYKKMKLEEGIWKRTKMSKLLEQM